jgi:hypothetical protein
MEDRREKKEWSPDFSLAGGDGEWRMEDRKERRENGVQTLVRQGRMESGGWRIEKREERMESRL